EEGGGVGVGGGRELARVVARHERHVERRAREAVPRRLRAPGHGSGRGRAAVEAVLDGDDLLAPRDAEREPERVLVGLGAAVDEEDAPQALGAESREGFGRGVAYGERQRVRLKDERTDLTRDRFRQL